MLVEQVLWGKKRKTWKGASWLLESRGHLQPLKDPRHQFGRKKEWWKEGNVEKSEVEKEENVVVWTGKDGRK